MKHSLLLPLALAALLIGAGCQTSETGALPPQNADKFNLEKSAKFVLLDPGAQRSVTCPGLQEGTLPDGRLRVRAQIRNRENRRIEVQVQCVFKDAQGFAIDTTSFQTLILTENATEEVAFEAMNDQAKAYTVRVRQAR
jgi:uncharacterized protein YcfL